MRFIVQACLAICLSSSAAFADFKISFDWGDIPRCTTGKPGRVGSPAFVLRGVPEGTTVIEFRLKDLDVPSFNHGGGKVKVGSNGKLPFGLFKYKSPCPPRGSHTYEWTATAKSGNKVLGRAKAKRSYP